MKRRHWFEFSDLEECPEVIRRMTPDFLATGFRMTQSYAAVAPQPAALLKEAQTDEIVDLCSGASGPLLLLRSVLEEEHHIRAKVTLTDKFPNLEAFAEATRISPGVTAVPDSVDARSVPPELVGVRTLFQSLHHFRPEEARAILQDAVTKRAPIAVFEGTERTWPYLFTMATVPILVGIFTPFIRPFTWSRMALTYLFPVAPAVVFWDALVSCLRSYTVDELRQFTDTLVGPPYTWETGRVQRRGQTINYLIGRPRGSP